ncbi:MAG: hypothetical protein GX622_04410 [Bacteroidales bacterium]|nr:hypothetical protein [Bacteroidales bacterium]
MERNLVLRWFVGWPDLLKYLGLISVTLAVTYYAPVSIRVIWYVILLTAYFFSRNEPLWLALFLSTSDGFFGFFGLYEATIPLLPGLPAVELLQFYVLITIFKAAGRGVKPVLFYNRYLEILLMFMIFSVVWGQMMGLTGGLNVYFRVVKGIIPMLLFYSIPRLFTDQGMYERFFRIVFVVVLLAFAAQLFALFTGMSTMEAGGIAIEEEKDRDEFRVFYNASSTLLGLFGALFILNRGGSSPHSRLLPFAVLLASMAMALLSATRGWIISFSFIIVLSVILTNVIRVKRNFRIVIIALPLIIWALSIPVISNQIDYARERLETMEAISEGDLTARGTLQRLDYRSQRTLGGWMENPIFGWGLSDKGYDYLDDHVGNQSILALYGVAGFLLLNGFLVWFIYMIMGVYFRLPAKHPYRGGLVVFVIFLLGWFFIHSTSGQQFSFSGIPEKIIPQAVFFSFGALQYNKALNYLNGKKV